MLTERYHVSVCALVVRERNRILARRTRLRKKFFFEVSRQFCQPPAAVGLLCLTLKLHSLALSSCVCPLQSLQKQVMDLKRENTLLKDVVRTRMSDAAPELLAKYNTQIPSIVAESMAEATR